MIRLVALAFALAALTSSAEAMPLPKLDVPDGLEHKARLVASDLGGLAASVYAEQLSGKPAASSAAMSGKPAAPSAVVQDGAPAPASL